MTEKKASIARILIVDDNEDDHFLLKRLLKNIGQVEAAYNGQEALDRLHSESFDVVITDQRMPRMSGAQLIEIIKSDPAIQSIPCILLSSLASPEELVNILSGGQIFSYFDKNFTHDERGKLVLSVRNAVHAHQLERERSRLLERLRRQVQAQGAQYKLHLDLVLSTSCVSALQQVLNSLTRWIHCRAALGLLSCSPSEEPCIKISMPSGQKALDDSELEFLRSELKQTYLLLAGPNKPDQARAQRDSRLESLQHNILPVFFEKELRGLLMLVCDRDEKLESDEAEIFRVWRDLFQDDCNRRFTQTLDEHRRLKSMVEAMTEGVIFTNERGDITLINTVAQQLLRISDDAPLVLETVLNALGISSMVALKLLLLCETRQVWHEVTLDNRVIQILLTSVRDHTGDYVGNLAVLRDISDAREQSKRQDEITHIISHELRSPITCITGILDVLGKEIVGELTPRQHQYIDMARASCQRLSDLSNDFLDQARWEQGRFPLELAQVDLRKVILETAQRFQAIAQEQDIQIIFNGGTSLDSYKQSDFLCFCDEHRIGQVLGNLLSNALKFSPQESSIKIDLYEPISFPDRFIVVVHNEGEEIAIEDQSTLFEKFRQLKSGERRGGSGLGLAISRSIVEAHGGEIWVESGHQTGTNLIFSLPRNGEAHKKKDDAQQKLEAIANHDRHILLLSDILHESYAIKSALLAMRFNVHLFQPGDDLQSLRGKLALCVCAQIGQEGVLPQELSAPTPDEFCDLHDFDNVPMLFFAPSNLRPPELADFTLDFPADPAMLESSINILLSRRETRRKLRILLVESDERFAHELALLLEQAGLLTYTVFTPRDAKKRLDLLRPDLICCNLDLPGALEFTRFCNNHAISTICRSQVEPTQSIEALEPLDAKLEPRDIFRAIRVKITKEHEVLHSFLPSARELNREMTLRRSENEPFVCCACDILGFATAVEEKGVIWGHAVMAQTIELVQSVLRKYPNSSIFLGHQHDNDLVFLIAPEAKSSVEHDLMYTFERLERLRENDNEPKLHLVLTFLESREELSTIDFEKEFQRLREINLQKK